jgi:hypothetical protein
MSSSFLAVLDLSPAITKILLYRKKNDPSIIRIRTVRHGVEPFRSNRDRCGPSGNLGTNLSGNLGKIHYGRTHCGGSLRTSHLG